MKRLLMILTFLIGWLALYAGPIENKDAEDALAEIDAMIAQEQRAGNTEGESHARWQKIVTLKNYSLTKEQAEQRKNGIL